MKKCMNWQPGTGLAIGIPIGVGLGLSLDNLAVGIALGIGLGVAFEAGCKKSCKKSGDARSNDVNDERSAEREAHVAEVLSAARGKGSITNDDVQKLLGVSDATATRYLSELESQGKLKQVGTTGQAVSYKPLS